MLREKVSLHSNSYKDVPNNLFYAIAQHKNIARFTLTENYIKKLLKKSQTKNNFNFSGGIEAENYEYLDNSNVKNQIYETITPTGEEESEHRIKATVDAIFTKNDYFLDDPKKFEREICSKKFKYLCNLLYKLESNKIVINFPAMDIPLYRIQEESLYYEKFMKKAISRIISLSKIASEEDIQILINYNPSHSISLNHDENFTGLEQLSSIFQIHFPFEDFISFRIFYDRLVESNEYIGLFLDISSYFISQTQYILQKLKSSENDDLFSGSFRSIDDYLLKNPKIADQLHNPLRNVEFLSGMGLSDIEWFDLFLSMYDNFHSPLDIRNFEFSNLLLKLFKQNDNKKLIGLGDLPLHSFFRSLHSLNTKSPRPNLLTFDYKLNADIFDYDFIDWRNIDVNKLNINSNLKGSINAYITQKKKVDYQYDDIPIAEEKIKRHPKYEYLLESQENPLAPTVENIMKHKVFSVELIKMSLKEFSGYF